MLAVALHLRGQELSLRDIAVRLVIATGKKKGQHPSPATVMRMLREHDERTAEVAVTAGKLTVPSPPSAHRPRRWRRGCADGGWPLVPGRGARSCRCRGRPASSAPA